MTKREARRLALLIISHELEGSLDVSDEWCSHPEGTGEEFDVETVSKLKAEGRRILDRIIDRAYRIKPASPRKKH